LRSVPGIFETRVLGRYRWLFFGIEAKREKKAGRLRR
jgi:hypothetical protein